MSEDSGTRAHQRLQSGGRLLVTRLRHVGDAILTLPLLAALRRAFPRAELHYLCEPPAHELLRHHPDIDVHWIALHGAGATLDLVRRLRAARFAAAIDLYSNPRSAALVRASGAPHRIGEWRRGRRRLYTVARRLPAGKSALEQHLDAIRSLGIEPPPPERPVLHLLPEERARGAALLHRLAPAGPRVVLQLGATHPAKEWPLAPALQLAVRLHAGGARVLLPTTPRRPEPSLELAAHAGAAVQLLAPMPLRELLGLVAHADVVVSVDGAVVHASVALGRPTLALFGPSDPRVWFPYTGFGPFRVLHAGFDCRGCDRERCPTRACMAALDADTALRHVLELLQSGERAWSVAP